MSLFCQVLKIILLSYNPQSELSPVQCRHIGQGVVIRQSEYSTLLEAFGKAWPWRYGSREINSQDARSKVHRDAYDLLISFIWPSGTESKYFGLEGFPPRAKFHTKRLDVCVGELN